MIKKIIGPALLLGLIVYVYMIVTNNIVVGYNKGYEPDQPLPYSHELHAGQLKIDCQYCHSSVETSRHATVPSLNICMNCHMSVKKDSKVLTQLKTSFYDNKPIEWQKVTLLPDHVKFDHSAHIRAGKECTTCHGAVETMSVVKQQGSLSMGWCVECHRKPENNAPTTCSTCHY